MRDALAALRDLLRGLFGFPAHTTAGRDPATAVERRYRAPRRCC